MNFSKEYIELCKNEKIQGLKKKYYQGDWIITKDKKLMVNIFDNIERLDYFWLPTGDQLDDEIVKTCKKKFKSPWYETRHNMYSLDAVIEHYVNGEPTRIYTDSDNSLIAKIKLLIQLLEAE